jgi:hypothetical protein
MDLIFIEIYEKNNERTIEIQTIKDLYSKFLWIHIIYFKIFAEITSNTFEFSMNRLSANLTHNNRGKFVAFIEVCQFKEHKIEICHGLLSTCKLKEQLNLCTKLLKVK